MRRRQPLYDHILGTVRPSNGEVLDRFECPELLLSFLLPCGGYCADGHKGPLHPPCSCSSGTRKQAFSDRGPPSGRVSRCYLDKSGA